MGYPTTVDTGMVTPWAISDEATIAISSATNTLTANTVYLYAFETQASITVNSIRYRNGSTATGTTDVGIYDSSGNLLGHSGAVSNAATTTKTANLTTALSLSPGQYYLAACSSNSTDTYVSESATANLAVMTRQRTAANAGTAGVLPATTGATSVAALAVAMTAILVGGLS